MQPKSGGPDAAADPEKEKAPGLAAQGAKGVTEDVQNPTPEAAARQEKGKSWFPVSRLDLAKIRQNYPSAQAARLVNLWCELLSCANHWGHTFGMTLDRLGGKLGITRQTAADQLRELERIKLLKMKAAKRGKGGRFDVSSITVKPSVPCKVSGKVNTDEKGAHRVKKQTLENLTDNNTSLHKAERGVYKKPSARGVSGGSPEGSPPTPRDGIGSAEDARARLRRRGVDA